MHYPITPAEVLVAQDFEEDRFLPEGPRSIVVDGREALIWVNIQIGPDSTRGAVHMRFWDNGERRSLPQESRPGFVLPTDRDGIVIVGREKEIGTLDLRTNEWVALATIPDSHPRTIINDGEAVPGGRAIVFGTKDVRFAEPIAHLYLFTLDDGKIWTLADGQTCSNGKFFRQSEGELDLYDIDTPRQNVVRYRLDVTAHCVGKPKVVLDLREFDGFPDGMVAWAGSGEGTSVWGAIIAFYNPQPAETGKAVLFRFDAETAKSLSEWTTPLSPRVTCPLLVKRNGKTRLVLTTADEGMAAELRAQCPNAGNLFIAETEFEQIPTVELVRL